MPVPLPDLSGWSFEELLREMIDSIPKYNRYWTNFNPSDPGITILEMLAWIAQTLIYRAEQIPEEMYYKFLQLAAGPDQFADPGDHANQRFSACREQLNQGIPADWESLKGATQRFLNSRYRAITSEDFRDLAQEASPRIKRVEVRETAGDEVELILVPERIALSNRPDPSVVTDDSFLIKTVQDYLKPRRLLGTPIRVRLAVYTPVKLKITLIGWSDAAMQSDRLKAAVGNRIRLYLDSFQGGPEGKGWPYGRNLTVFDLFYVLEKVEGVKHIRETAGWNDGNADWRPFQELKIDGLIDLQQLEIIMEKDED